MKRILFVLICVVLIAFVFPGTARVAAAPADKVKELNFVFLHGFNGQPGSVQLLQDSLVAQLPAYVTNYEYDHPDIKVETDTLNRSYPNNVDIESWANNIADSVNNHFGGKKNLVLVGHSMGGKSALYAVAHNIGNIADKVAMVVTVNSPIKSLANYFFVGGDTSMDFWGARLLMSNQGALESLVNYDSSQDGQWVGTHKRWLAFISSETSPLSSQFDTGGIDTLPRDMDDSIVPISAQYADGADVVYYGEYGHSDFSDSDQVSGYLANQILNYVFGATVECSVFSRGGTFEHKADLFPGTDRWQDLVGDVLAASGTIMHRNESYFRWQEWEDTVGEPSAGVKRSNFQTIQKKSFSILTGITEARWANAEDDRDERIYIKTRAAPRANVQVDWSVYQQGLLPAGITRDHYEIEIDTGAQFTGIGQVAWETSDPRDVRLRISSQAESPFRRFRTNWRVYYKEGRQRPIIDDLPVLTSPG